MMNAAPNLLLRERRKPALDQIDPGGAGGRKVNVKAWTLSKPATDRCGFVRAVVVEYQMHIQIAGHRLVNRIEKLSELQAAMPPVEFPDHRAGLHIESGKQRSRAMPRIIVSPALHLAGTHRQQRLRAIQCLDLTFSSTHKTNARSGGSIYRPTISRTLSMNSGSLDSLNVSLRCGCSAKACQMRPTVLRLRPACLAKDRVLQCVASFGVDSSVIVSATLHIGITHFARRTRTRFIQQSVQSPIHKTLPPLAHGLASHLNLACHCGVGHAFCTAQYDSRPQRQSLRRLGSPSPILQRLLFGLGQTQYRNGASSSHRKRSPILGDVPRSLLVTWTSGSRH